MQHNRVGHLVEHERHLPDTTYSFRNLEVIDLRADADLLPEALPPPRLLCLLDLPASMKRGTEAKQAERDLPPISYPYWEHGCALLDIVDDHAHGDNEPERELTESELMCETVVHLKSAMRAHWKDIANDLTSRKHEGGGHGRNTAEIYAAAIVHAQWRRSKADVVTMETIEF